MKTYHHIFYLVVFILICSNVFANKIEERIVNVVKDDVSKYFITKYKIHPQDLEIVFKRLPEYLEEDDGLFFRVTDAPRTYKMGYQTIWVDLMKSSSFKMKFPVSIEVSILRQVAVTKKRIKRGQQLSTDLLDIKTLAVNTDLQKLFCSFDQLEKFESAKYIKPGTLLTKNMVRIPPVLKRGDHVEIRVNLGHLFISTPGIVKEDGKLGEEVNVICQESRKKLTGVVKTPNLVLVNNNGY